MMKFWKIPIHEAKRFVKEQIDQGMDNPAAYAIYIFALNELIKYSNNGAKFIYTEVRTGDIMPADYTAEQVDSSEFLEE